MKRKKVRKIQFLIVSHASALALGVISTAGLELISLRLSVVSLFSSTMMVILILQLIRPMRYKAIVKARRQRDKAMQRAKDLESQRIIVQNISNNMNIFGDNNGNMYVEGDYVNTKHVTNEVNGVAEGGTGINVNK